MLKNRTEKNKTKANYAAFVLCKSLNIVKLYWAITLVPHTISMTQYFICNIFFVKGNASLNTDLMQHKVNISKI